MLLLLHLPGLHSCFSCYLDLESSFFLEGSLSPAAYPILSYYCRRVPRLLKEEA
jgi:hypothetical protein